jgi:hypothetical protein
MIEGGPCSECGATQASIWYGRRGGPKYCKKADCLRAGGYLLPKKAKGLASKRVRAERMVEEVPESINLDSSLSELIDVYGQR